MLTEILYYLIIWIYIPLVKFSVIDYRAAPIYIKLSASNDKRYR
jgi:hypothetical protein